MALKAKDIGRLPDYAVSTAQETLQSLQTMESACKALIKKPALTELSMSDANDLVRCAETCLSSVHIYRPHSDLSLKYVRLHDRTREF